MERHWKVRGEGYWFDETMDATLSSTACKTAILVFTPADRFSGLKQQNLRRIDKHQFLQIFSFISRFQKFLVQVFLRRVYNLSCSRNPFIWNPRVIKRARHVGATDTKILTVKWRKHKTFISILCLWLITHWT